MTRKILLLVALLVCSLSGRADELVYQDSKGVVRLKSDRSEVRLFGANYCVPSACDYRAAGMVGADRKRMIDDDLSHFARMGWDGIRLSFWGDWECCDKAGNLIENDHLDLLDYLVWKASERRIGMLFSPIVTYDASWPDKTRQIAMPGFSAHYRKDELITSPEVIAAECNYLKQLLNHVNPYTGRRLADEPWIYFVELINEPSQMPDKPKETIACIEALAKAVRSTGCKKLLYYNISQDCRIIPVVTKTSVDGGTYAWYPTALNNGYELPGNFLPSVADYPKEAFDIGKRSRLVYEFDSPDLLNSYMFPAMAREFRRGGVQFAAMFAYDMLATAQYNLGWQTHHLNMVYTPRKTIGAMIAAEAIRRLDSGGNYGPYPENNRFGDFLVDADRDLSLLNAPDALLFSNDISDIEPVDLKRLSRIAGIGRSTVAESNGNGIFFLDKVRTGVWRLEVHPNIYTLSDPFRMPSPTRRCYAVAHDTCVMRVVLPDLGEHFHIAPIGGGSAERAEEGCFNVLPGIYLLSAEPIDMNSLPAKVNGVEMTAYLTAEASMPAEPVLLHSAAAEYVTGEPIRIECTVCADQTPAAVTLFVNSTPDGYPRPVAMKRAGHRTYAVELPAADKPGRIEYRFGIQFDSMQYLFPGGSRSLPSMWDYAPVSGYSARIVSSEAPLRIFSAEDQARKLFYTRVFRSVPYKHRVVYDDRGDACVEMECNGFMPSAEYQFPLDVSVSAYVGDIVDGRTPRSVTVEAEALTSTTEKLLLTLHQSNCRAWSAEIPITAEMSRVEIPVAAFGAGHAPMLPQDWPGVNPYWYPSLNRSNDTIDWSKIERCIVSMRPDIYADPATPKGIRIKSIELNY